MAKDSDHLAGSFDTENTGGFLTGLLAEEDNFDRRTLWRLGSWAAASVGAVIVAVMSNHSSIGLHRDQVAGTDLARQSQQIQSVAKESQNEARRLASAIETLNGDRDRLYSRVTVLEQGLESVTGAIARQSPAAALPQVAATASAATEPQSAPQNPVAAPVVSPVAAAAPATPAEKPAVDTAAARNSGPAPVPSVAQGTPNSPATPTVMPLMASKSILAPPETAANAVTASPMPEVVAPAASADDAERDPPWAASSKVAVQRTEFGVDVGGANSLGGLRALWRGLKSNTALAALRPIIVVKESTTGLGMQLRLVAGPLADAAAAAKICAALLESQRPCETTVFDGQRLAMKAEEPPASVKPAPRKRSIGKRAVVEEPPQKPETTLSSLFTRAK